MKFLFDQEAVELNWNDREDKMPFEEKKKILLSLGRQDYYNQQLEGSYKENYASHYHFVDLNKDGNDDVVYNSADGADAAIFMIWINNNGSYQRIMRKPGDILFVNWNTSTFLVDQPAFMEEKAGYIFKIQVTRTGVKTDSYQVPIGAYLPSSFSDISTFDTMNDNYNLRSSPMVKNEPCEEYPDGSELCGNLFLTVKKGTEGQAIAKSTDDTGRIWWLSKLNIRGAKTVGWLSSRFVQKR